MFWLKIILLFNFGSLTYNIYTADFKSWLILTIFYEIQSCFKLSNDVLCTRKKIIFTNLQLVSSGMVEDRSPHRQPYTFCKPTDKLSRTRIWTRQREVIWFYGCTLDHLAPKALLRFRDNHKYMYMYIHMKMILLY